MNLIYAVIWLCISIIYAKIGIAPSAWGSLSVASIFLVGHVLTEKIDAATDEIFALLLHEKRSIND